MLKKSWESYPFVDIIVQDAQDPCPSEFPEEVIYGIFPGTRFACDCLESIDDPHIMMDENCILYVSSNSNNNAEGAR